MKITFTLLFILFASSLVFCQTRLIKGQLLSDEDGSPLPGVNVVIKGTTTGTVTDINGYYEIHAPIGSILVFSFVGLTTREVLVTSDQGVSRYNQLWKEFSSEEAEVLNSFVPARILSDTTGIAYLREDSPTYKTSGKFIPARIANVSKRRNGNYFISMDDDPLLSENMKFQFTSGFGIELVNRIPRLQRNYSQGIPAGGITIWQSPETGIPFSWGPDLRTLQFDGSPYLYDLNGRLEQRDGTGKPANKYDNTSFFRTGQSFMNEFALSSPIFNNGLLYASIDHELTKYILHKAGEQRLGTLLRITNLHTGMWEFGGHISHNRTYGTGWSHGGSLSRVISGILTAPVTFDNSNGLSPRQATGNTQSYLLPDGSPRNFASGFDNPYGIVNEFPATDDIQETHARINLNLALLDDAYDGHLDLKISNYLRHFSLESAFGVPESYSPNPVLTQRNLADISYGSDIGLIYTYHDYPFSLTGRVSYTPHYAQINLERLDQNPLETGAGVNLNATRHRMVHEIKTEGTATYRSLELELGNMLYMSSTSDAYSFLPYASISADLNSLLDLYLGTDLTVFFNYAKSLRETDLILNHWSYVSLDKPVGQFTEVYENNEVLTPENILPAFYSTTETGIRAGFDQFSTDVSVYRQYINDFILYDPRNSMLTNSGDLLKRGIEFSFNYYSYHANQLDVGLRFNAWDERMTSLTDNEPVPLSGFNSIRSMAMEGEPLGVIYGTTYLRDANGNRVIGQDGFPIEDPELKRIGNPVPDWTLGVYGSMRLGNFNINLSLDGRRGGEVWNGTQAYLDYLGRSEITGSQRHISQYIFEGVTENGTPNIKPVSFYDPGNPLQDNRWVRYGEDGVGEDYIEDTSWIRIREISVSCSLKNLTIDYLQEIDLILSAGNILLYSGYQGADPESALFNYDNGQALDLFNVPSSTRLNAKIIVKF